MVWPLSVVLWFSMAMEGGDNGSPAAVKPPPPKFQGECIVVVKSVRKEVIMEATCMVEPVGMA